MNFLDYNNTDIKNFIQTFGYTVTWKSDSPDYDAQSGARISNFFRKEIKVILNPKTNKMKFDEVAKLDETDIKIGTIHNLKNGDEIIINGKEYIVRDADEETDYNMIFSFKYINLRRKVLDNNEY